MKTTPTEILEKVFSPITRNLWGREVGIRFLNLIYKFESQKPRDNQCKYHLYRCLQN